MFAKHFLTGAAMAASLGMAGAASAEQTFITIGTGGVTGVYYPTGGAICRLVNKDRKEHNIRCSVESTGGSVYNTRTIREGELDFGIVQSDVQSAAMEGVRAFDGDEPYADLRAVFSVHPEPMHVMVREDADINSVMDMKGKRVNIGNPGSGTRVLADVLMEAAGVTPGDFSLAAELKSSEQAAALCDGKIDAAIWAAGLPNGSTMEATSTCGIKILDLTTSGTDKVLSANPAYAAATIPAGLYPGNDAEIASWGPKATFVADANTPDEVVYVLVKAVFENFEDFKKLHPAFGRLTEEEMIKDGLSAPLHPGAAKYYAERGWM
ncbi:MULTISPECIES: TAXI family TRAP transporter solute-binding subunit [Roseobacter]|uniref:TRAP transporter solute receptor, TAXI family n=1 Tax=Roseobacter litoralis (strain ATCC 49566 / DSM 6996 / JCM 21268 / NBRC 15278 / OCh 149) TaxID=391595 RepID=F7ZHH7_ROSLO|nr:MULTISPECIES: TAXI family TRAP transporter solute-binding subunit [Roseobacter]AEI92388.1 TRAP transporter solute receptor, TAXI family [Roseobacter litoralis Och 149]GIT88568.1 C4-dicarboxylate ABC transporter substrate-binding protein [Roseobacter sp. OBYS 0001]